MIPTIFGYPLWYGRIKRRVAKKYINRWSIGKIWKWHGKTLSTMDVGSIINDCSGFNGEVKEAVPFYRSVAGGHVLVDIDFTTSNTGCSLIHCGVSPGLSQEQVEAQHLAFLEGWFFGEGGKKWFGNLDDPHYKDQVDRARRKLENLKSGGHITDERGMLLPEFK